MPTSKHFGPGNQTPRMSNGSPEVRNRVQQSWSQTRAAKALGDASERAYPLENGKRGDDQETQPHPDDAKTVRGTLLHYTSP